MIACFHKRIQEVHRLANELHDLLAYNRSILEYRGVHSRAKKLAQWVDSYHYGLRYGLPMEDKKSSEEGKAWLAGLSDRLRLEAGASSSSGHESGVPIEKHSTAYPETEDFIESAHRIMMACSPYLSPMEAEPLLSAA